MATRNLQKHYLRIIQRWPKDELRSLTVPDALRRRLEARIRAALPAEGTTTAPQPTAERSDAAQINALYSLLEDRYSTLYPASSTLLEPAFNPSYYADLRAEMAAAPHRGWWARKWLRWSKVVRLS